MTAKMVNHHAGFKFLLLGAGWLIVGFVGLMMLRMYSRRRAIGFLLFMALAFNVGLTSMLLGMSLPLFWHLGFFSLVGTILFGYFVAVLIYQLWRAHRQFFKCWEENHAAAVASFYHPAQGVIDVPAFMRALRIKTELFLPAKLELLSGFIWFGLILSAIVGLNLRRIYPEFSAFAWGLPALTVVAVIVQWSFNPILLAIKFREIERKSGTTIAPMAGGESGVKAGRRKGKPR